MITAAGGRPAASMERYCARPCSALAENVNSYPGGSSWRCRAIRSTGCAMTTSTRRPARRGLGMGISARRLRAIRKRTRNVEPSLTALSTSIPPPMASARCFEIDNPRPVPPNRRVIELSACLNGLNKDATRPGAMPMPVSRIEISSCRASPAGLDEAPLAGGPTRRCVDRPSLRLAGALPPNACAVFPLAESCRRPPSPGLCFRHA